MFDPKNDSQDFSGNVIYSPRRPRQPGDIDENERTGLAKRSGVPIPGVSELDGAQAQAIWSQLRGSYTHELDRQADNREQMAADDALFDHSHYTDDELASYAERGQTPIVYNISQTTVNWVLGSQRRAPTDYRVLPRKKEGGKAADAKSQLLKHLSDTNRSEFEWSQAFSSAVRAGIGWMECGQGRPDEGTKVFDRAEDWRFMLWDSTSRRYDLMDSRYIHRSKWLDSDLAMSIWHKRKGVVEQSADVSRQWGITDDMGDDPMDSQETGYFEHDSSRFRGQAGFMRARVRVVETWFKRVDPKAAFMRGGQFHGEMFDDWSPGHWKEIVDGVATLSVRPTEVIHVALYTDAGLLSLQRSPFRHNRYPFTPVWGYRRANDGLPYGMIRGIRDIQRSFNKQKSKALHYLASTRVTVEQGAVDDLEELRVEAARPDAMIVHKPGRPAPRIEVQADMAGVHIEMARDDANLIQSVGGVTDENMGRRTNATSGIAIQRRQDQGQLATSMFFDNMRQSRGIHGEKLMILIESYYTAKDVIRITDARGKPDWLNINSGDEDAIGAFKADFVMGEEDWRISSRAAQFEMMMGVLKDLGATAPQLVLAIIDLVIEGSDVPKRDEIVKRIRQFANLDDPDADPDNPDPETQAKKAQQAEQNDLARRAAWADVLTKEAEARKKGADATKAESVMGDAHIDRLMKAIDAAVAVAGAPAVVAAAERVLLQASQAEVQAKQQAGAPVAPPPAPPPQPPAQPPEAMMQTAPAPTPEEMAMGI